MKKTAKWKVESGRFPLLKRRYDDYVQWCSDQLGVGRGSSAVMGFSDYCARGHTGLVENSQSLSLQRQRNKKKEFDRGRSCTDNTDCMERLPGKSKKIFECYRKLISFKQKGDPAVLLKTINPSEVPNFTVLLNLEEFGPHLTDLQAKLLDKASGGCVRFRLGGCDFPPSIYYKIFTSQAVVDVCSYSPRDYTAMTSRLLPQRDKHNHGCRIAKDDDGSNWYKRWENNGWRLVSERLFQSRLQDSVTIETSAKRQSFHHSTLQRKADLERRRKRKKIEWLKKLYQPQPETQAKEETTESADLEDEVDTLLGWSRSLNFEEYVSDWSQIATSAGLPATSCDSHMTT
ncbi:Protein MFI [Geodia barretti]|uniref:Protein MFI n=1 Tax=Geodia barretti TaxID=519541 RepID=A0AA35WEQ6_GEOBA|nr:Protein MFI [Geodia barretti]